VIVGLSRADDAGVYKISDDLALIQTVDFFTPVVDDPYMFGQIAAANALSDVYAMGGVPRTAMNLVCFPAKEMDLSVLREIVQGGIDKVKEAGCVLIGGHTVEDKELKYGLSVTGVVHPDRVLTKSALQAGDRLVITKPLGTGIVNTAIKAGLASEAVTDRVTRQMAALNRQAARVMDGFSVHACTDVTGFGLIGHLAEMVEKSGCSVRIESAAVPRIEEAIEYAAMGLIPAGAYRNREFRAAMIVAADDVSRARQDLLFDPQTSGGLLVALPADQAERYAASLRAAGLEAAVIGRVTGEGTGRIRAKKQE